MKAKVLVLAGLTAALLMISASVFAHHSNAPSDKDRLVTVSGTVSRFAFLNPHVGVYVDVKDSQGKVVTWYAAGNTPVALNRDAGWTNKTFKPGEQILVQGHPNRDGRPLMIFMRLYRCSGEMVPLDKAKLAADEYLTRVKIVNLEPTRVQAACSGKEPIADIFGELANGKN